MKADGPPATTRASQVAGRAQVWRRSARGYILLPHLVPVLVVEFATIAFAFIAWGGMPPAQRVMPLLLAMLGGQLAIGATNEIVDLPVDAVSKPSKPIPSGAVSLRGARMMVLAGLVMMILFGTRFGLLAFGLLALGTGFGIAYDLYFKRTSWSWLPYLLALPLLPIWVFTALGKPEPRLFWLYPLGALAAVGVHLAQALPDVSIDRDAGLRTVTSRSGFILTFIFAWLATISAPFLAWFVVRWLGVDPPFSEIAFAAAWAAGSLAVNVLVFTADRRLGVTLCFPLVAISTLLSGIAWALTITS